VIFVTVDLMEHLDKFIDSETPRAEIVRYYVLYLPQIVYLVTPVAMLLTTVFTLGGMVRTSEITAIKACGVSPLRILRLLSCWSVLISLGIFLLGESLVTDTARERMEIYRTRIRKRPATLRQNSGRIYFQNSPSSMFTLENYNLEEGHGSKAVFLEFDGGRLRYRADAKEAELRDGVWTFLDGSERQVHPEETYRTFEELPLPGLLLKHEDVQSLQSAPEEMNLAELRGFIERQRQAGARITRWQVNQQIKLAAPLANFVIVFFGVPLSLRRARGGLALGFAISLLCCFLYYGLQVVCRNLGYKELLDPLGAGWIPNILFVLLGAWLYSILDR